MSLMHGFVEVRDRYHAYLVPLLMPVAGYAVAVLVNRVRPAPADSPGEPARFAPDEAAETDSQPPEFG